MQSTFYAVMLEAQKGYWIEITPRPRSRRAALERAEQVSVDNKHVRVERHTRALAIVKTFNRPAPTPREAGDVG